MFCSNSTILVSSMSNTLIFIYPYFNEITAFHATVLIRNRVFLFFGGIGRGNRQPGRGSVFPVGVFSSGIAAKLLVIGAFHIVFMARIEKKKREITPGSICCISYSLPILYIVFFQSLTVR